MERKTWSQDTTLEAIYYFWLHNNIRISDGTTIYMQLKNLSEFLQLNRIFKELYYSYLGGII